MTNELKVKVKKTDGDNCIVNLSIEADKDLIKDAQDTAVVQIRSRAQMPGFRTGKVPLSTVKENFKTQIEERTVDIAIRKALEIALEKEKINPIAPPTVKEVDYKEGKPLKFEVEIETVPEITPKNYEKINLLEHSTEITPQKLDEELQKLREHNARLEASQDGTALESQHFATVSYKAYKDGKEIEKHSTENDMIDMSSPQTIKGLPETIIGAKKGETKEFDTEIEKEKITFKVTVNEIKSKILPELNDDFAKQMNFENIDKLKSHVSEMMTKNAKRQSEESIMKQIEEHLLKHNDFQIPKSLVDRNADANLDRVMQNMGENASKITDDQKKQYKEQICPSVEKDLKMGYLLNAIAKKEKIEVTDDDIKKELETSLQKTKTEKEKKQIEEFFNSKKPHILLALTERKVFDFLKSTAVIKSVDK